MTAGDLVAFLTARLDEDEAAAQLGGLGVPAPADYTGLTRHLSVWLPELVQARVLREVDAKRKILAEHTDIVGSVYMDDYSRDIYCARCVDSDRDGGYYTDEKPGPCPTLRALAAVYSGHPDYDQAWA